MQYVVTESCPQMVCRASQASIPEAELGLQLRAQLQFKINSILSSMLLILTFTLKWYKLLYQSLPAECVVMHLSGT